MLAHNAAFMEIVLAHLHAHEVAGHYFLGSLAPERHLSCVATLAAAKGYSPCCISSGFKDRIDQKWQGCCCVCGKMTDPQLHNVMLFTMSSKSVGERKRWPKFCAAPS